MIGNLEMNIILCAFPFFFKFDDFIDNKNYIAFFSISTVVKKSYHPHIVVNVNISIRKAIYITKFLIYKKC